MSEVMGDFEAWQKSQEVFPDSVAERYVAYREREELERRLQTILNIIHQLRESEAVAEEFVENPVLCLHSVLSDLETLVQEGYVE